MSSDDPQTLGTWLERDRLERRARSLRRAIADFEAQVEAINTRLRAIAPERASTQLPRSMG